MQTQKIAEKPLSILPVLFIFMLFCLEFMKELTSINIMLTNRPNSLKYTCAITGLNACHNLIVSSFRAHFNRLPPTQVFYRDVFSVTWTMK